MTIPRAARTAATLAAAAAAGAVLAFLVASSPLLQQDDYYHIQAARLLRTQGIVREFPWLPHTVLQHGYSDLHFLYHVLLIPFTFGDLAVGAKAAAVVFALAAAALLYLLLSRAHAPYRVWLVLLYLLGSGLLTPRLLAVRPIALGHCFLFAAMTVLLERRYVWLAPIAYAFVIAYSGFIVLVPLVGIFALVESFHQRRLAWRPVAWLAAGVAAGLLVHPYFPSNLRIFYVQIVRGSLFRGDLEPNLEWLPLSSWSCVLGTWGTLATLFLCLVLLLRSARERPRELLFLFAATVVCLCAYLRYLRGVDWFVPLAVVFCAVAARELRAQTGRPLKVLGAAVVAACVLSGTLSSHRALSGAGQIDNAGSARWLAGNTPVGSEVFLTNAGAFPAMFFYDTNNVYTVGHDALFMEALDAGLYRQYRAAVELRVDPYPVIKSVFGAAYVHVENTPRNTALYGYLQSSPDRFTRVYQDRFAAVYLVR